MSFATLRLPLIIALLLLSLAELITALLTLVLIIKRSAWNVAPQEEVPDRLTNAVLVCGAGALGAVGWAVLSIITYFVGTSSNGPKQRHRPSSWFLQTRTEIVHNITTWAVHLASAILFSSTTSTSHPAMITTVPSLVDPATLHLDTLLPLLALLAWLNFALLSVLSSLTLALFIRRWAAFENGVSKLSGRRLWEDGWWGGVCIERPAGRGCEAEVGVSITLNDSMSSLFLDAHPSAEQHKDDQKDVKAKEPQVEEKGAKAKGKVKRAEGRDSLSLVRM